MDTVDFGYCVRCGGTMCGDGYMVVLHCEHVDVTALYVEPDAGPIYCDFNEED